MAFPLTYEPVAAGQTALSADMNEIRKVVAGLPTKNVLGHYGVNPSGTAASITAALQGALNDFATWGTLEIPPEIYDLNARLDWPVMFGRIVKGAGREATILNQTANNVPIIRFNEEIQHSLSLRDMQLAYQTQQTDADTGAVAMQFYDSAGASGGWFWSVFRNLRIHQAYDGIAIGGGGSNPIWGNSFKDILITRVAHTGVDVTSPVSIGMPSLFFHNLEIINTGGGPTPTGPAVKLSGPEAQFINLDVEGWNNEVLFISSGGYCAIRGLHVESHTWTGSNPRMIYIANGPLTIEDANIAGTMSGTGLLRFVNGDTGSTIRASRWRWNVTLSSGTAQLFHSGSADSYIAEDCKALGGGTVTIPAPDAATLAKVKQIDQVIKVPTTTKTGAYTATITDEVILCDASGGAFSVTLPAVAGCVGKQYTIKRTSASNNVTIDGNASETIDGATTKVLGSQYAFVTIVGNGTVWSIVAQGGTVT